MRFSIIDREPFFETVRDNLEKMIKNTNCDNGIYQPLTEIRENEKAYIIKIQIPGIKKDDIQVELNENNLSVKAERNFECNKENESVLMSEFSYGQFVKTIEFAKDIDAEKAESEYKDGILKITLYKKEEILKNEVKKIAVK